MGPTLVLHQIEISLFQPQGVLPTVHSCCSWEQPDSAVQASGLLGHTATAVGRNKLMVGSEVPCAVQATECIKDIVCGEVVAYMQSNSVQPVLTALAQVHVIYATQILLLLLLSAPPGVRWQLR